MKPYFIGKGLFHYGMLNLIFLEPEVNVCIIIMLHFSKTNIINFFEVGALDDIKGPH